MRRKLAHLATADVDPEALDALTELQEAAVERMAKAEKLTPDAGQRGRGRAQRLAGRPRHRRRLGPGAALVAAGVKTDWLDEIAETVPRALLADGIHWVAYALETEQLMVEIEDSTDRISTLVGAAKQYSQMDRAAHQDIDVHDGLKSTLVMLGHKIKESGRIRLVKDYDRGPAADARAPGRAQPGLDQPDRQRDPGDADGGTLTDPDRPGGRLRAGRDRRHRRRDPEGAAAEDLRAVLHHQAGGRGHRARPGHLLPGVTQRHGGDLRVVSEPGDTRFQVRLPLAEPPSLG